MPREKIAIWPTSMASRISARQIETLAGNRTITIDEIETYNALAFDPGGAGRDVTLPAVGGCHGVFLVISNKADGVEILTIKNAGGTAILTPAQGEAAFLWCDGVSWYGLVGAQS